MRTDNSGFSNCKSIAIMGGTFDPIHFGHLVTAEAVRHEFQIQKVLFIPTGIPPHKDNSMVSDSEHRYLMSVLATVTNPFFEVSRLEIEREGSTYTIDTIKQLHDICSSKTKFYFITGSDAIEQILTWKNTEELLSLCEFVAVSRPGYHKRKLIENIDNISNHYESKIHFLEVPALSISSTDIRNRVNTGKPIKYLLPEAVENYIYKRRLYIDKR